MRAVVHSSIRGDEIAGVQQQKGCSRISGNVLACVCRMWERGASGPLSRMGIGFLGVAFAFGLTVLTMAYALGHVSGGHLNPAVSVGLCVAKRLPANELLLYVVSQLSGAVLASGVLYTIASGKAGFTTASGFAANGYGDHSPGAYGLGACFLMELVMTFIFLIVILGATDKRAPKGMGPLAIGSCLTLIHLVSIPVTNTSVNPARSTAPALFVGGWALGQLWLFWLAPILGAAIAGVAYRFVVGEPQEETATPASKAMRAAAAGA